jgi:N-acetylglucosamine kinase-like BadF-type ATPase
MSRRLVLGLDAGGSKSVARAAVADDALTPVGQWSGGAANLTVHGVDDVATSLTQLIQRASDQTNDCFAAMAIAVAGAGDESLRGRLERKIARSFPACPIVVTHDGAPLFEFASGESTVVVIAGTGSLVIGRGARPRETLDGPVKEPIVTRCGGWGPLLGDQGSAYRIVLDSLARALQQIDPLVFDSLKIPPDRGSSPCLTAILRELAVEDLGTLKVIANDPTQRPRMARCFPHVLQLADDGDVLTQSVVQEHATALACHVEKVWRQVVQLGQDTTLVLSGGALIHQPTYRRRVLRAIELNIKPTTVVLAQDPVEGAIRMAIRLLSRQRDP